MSARIVTQLAESHIYGGCGCAYLGVLGWAEARAARRRAGGVMANRVWRCACQYLHTLVHGQSHIHTWQIIHKAQGKRNFITVLVLVLDASYWLVRTRFKFLFRL